MVRLEGAGVHVYPAAVEDGTAHAKLILVLRTWIRDARCEQSRLTAPAELLSKWHARSIRWS
jgi:hypothetical protein